MERCEQHQRGGIASLGDLIEEHPRALNFDLLSRVGVSLYDIPGPISWDDVRDIVSYLDASSALVSEMHPEIAGWQGDQKTPMLLAQICDLLSGLQYSYTICHMKKGAQKPKEPIPIPRPGIAAPEKQDRHWGSGAIKMSSFADWWDRCDDESDE